MRILEKFKKFISLPGSEKTLFLEALFLQYYIGSLLKIIPFKWIPRLFSQHRTQNPELRTNFPEPGTRNLKPGTSFPEPGTVFKESRTQNPELRTVFPEPGTQNSELGTIIPIKTAIQRSSPLCPWRNKCMVQSLSARRMLNRRKIPSQLSLGVALGEHSKMIAHAWLKSDDFEIVEKRGDYSELYLF